MCRNGGGGVDPVAGLAAAVASLAEVDLAHLPAAAQLELLRQVWPLLCQLDAQLTRIVGVVNAQGSSADEGALSTTAWLRSALHAGGAGPRVQVAKALRGLPDVAAAFSRGDISFTHAHLAAKTARDLDPAVLAPDTGELLRQTLGALMPPVNPDDLVPATTRALALGQLCRLAAEAAPQAGGARPQVTVTIDLDTLRGQAAGLFNRHGAWTGGRLGSGTRLAPETRPPARV